MVCLSFGLELGPGAGGRELDRNLLPWSIPKQRVSRFACSCVAEGRFWQGGVWEGNGVAGLLLLTICHCRINVARENRVDSCPSELGREGGCQACSCELVILLPTVLQVPTYDACLGRTVHRSACAATDAEKAGQVDDAIVLQGVATPLGFKPVARDSSTAQDRAHEVGVEDIPNLILTGPD